MDCRQHFRNWIAEGLPVNRSQRATGANHISEMLLTQPVVATIKAMALRIPDRLAVSCRKTPQRAAWLERLPDVLRDLEHRWSLTLEVPFDDEVSCAYVAAAVHTDATRAVVKIGMPHMEGEHEIHGLRFWDGDPLCDYSWPTMIWVLCS